MDLPSVGSIFGQEIKSAIITGVMCVCFLPGFSGDHQAGTQPMRSMLLNEIRGNLSTGKHV
jgi:hypothetical protein